MRKVALTIACPHAHRYLGVSTTRRGFLGHAIRLGMATAAAPLLLEAAGPRSMAEAGRAIKFSHGSGLCNMPLFYAAERKLFEKYGIDDDVVMTPMAGTSAIQLATGQVEMGVIPYTSTIGAYTRSPTFSIVAGSGIQGLIVVAKPEIKSLQELQGKKIGSFQADTLEILIYDYLKKLGFTYQDVQMQYMGDSFELTSAFIAGHLDAITSVEPYATRAKMATNGNILGDGTDLYGTGFPDCVLVARKELIAKEPEVVKNVIRVFLEAEYEVAVWEVAAALQLIDPLILPPPHLFIAEIHQQAQFLLPKVGVRRVGANFVALTAIVASLQRVMIGLVLAFATSLALGSLAFYISIFGKLTLPTITLLAPIAPVAWIPFALVAFGIGDAAAVFVVFIGIVFTLTLGTVNHMKHVDQLYIDTARVLGASRRQVIQHVIFPAVLPNLFVIMRINLSAAWTGVLAAEMVGVRTGMGAIVVVGRQMMNMNLTFLGMAMIGLVGYLLDAAFGLVQRRVLWWKSSAQV